MTGEPEMVRRVAATTATTRAFEGQPFAWGRVDCARMVAAHLRRMGHQVRLPPEGAYRTEAGARRELRARGFATVADAVDALGLPRIAPAEAWCGDVVQLGGVEDLGALGVQLSNGRVLAFLEDRPGACIGQPRGAPLAAWRVTWAA